MRHALQPRFHHDLDCHDNTLKKESKMEIVFMFLILMVVIDLLAWRKGFESRDGIDSPEWERRNERGMFA